MCKSISPSLLYAANALSIVRVVSDEDQPKALAAELAKDLKSEKDLGALTGLAIKKASVSRAGSRNLPGVYQPAYRI